MVINHDLFLSIKTIWLENEGKFGSEKTWITRSKLWKDMWLSDIKGGGGHNLRQRKQQERSVW